MRDTAQFLGGVGIEIAVTAANRAKRNVDISVKGRAGIWSQRQLTITWPAKA
ncbi:MAG: hypothetical protein RL028_891 [Actinomycetota bacterium]